LRFPLFLNKIICGFFFPTSILYNKSKYNVSLLNMKVITIDYHMFLYYAWLPFFFQSLILTIYELVIIFWKKKWSIGLFDFVYVDVEYCVIHQKVKKNDHCFNEFQAIPNRNLSFVFIVHSIWMLELEQSMKICIFIRIAFEIKHVNDFILCEH
jgi:hypothetical protein